jgi:putative ubiquitin-RnfH superfamily antitoxin RatB of RatAB toxin-antitoxin module
MAEGVIRVQVCHARPDRQFLREIEVAAGTTLQSAIEQSGVLQEVPEIDIGACRVGIHGKLKPPDTVLRERDRIEIYRPLIAGPMEARRRRAVKKAA